jgi:GNAT superfamily N-acetyltransferase
MTADDPRDAPGPHGSGHDERAARNGNRVEPSVSRATPDDEPATTIRVGLCTPADLERLEHSGTPDPVLRHHRERFAMQERGECVQLLAWHEDAPTGHGTLLLSSKYGEVSARWPGIVEVNALAAWPTGRGTGTVLLAAAEDAARSRGCARIGIAVEPGNPDARRLYERLGYRLVDGLRVIDRWTEQHGDGTRIDHADPCDYLVKDLRRDGAERAARRSRANTPTRSPRISE